MIKGKEDLYVSIDLNRDRMDTRSQVISDRRDPGASLSTLKRFIVESGKPGPSPIETCSGPYHSGPGPTSC